MAPPSGLTRISIADTLAFFADVVLPTLGKGILIRRPRVVGLAEKFGLDSRAVQRFQKLRAKYGTGPLLLAVPLRRQAVVFAPDHAHQVLGRAPEPFSPATREKRATLAHFEPNVSLASYPPRRAERRRFNDDVLESSTPVHSMAGRLLDILHDEAARLLRQGDGELRWEPFITSWYAMVRRIVLGSQARDDHELTDMLAKLRFAANWAFLHPGRPALRKRFHARLAEHLARAEPGSMAERIAARSSKDVAAPTDQVAQFLFAFDAAGIATFRALACIAAHPEAQARVRSEIANNDDKRLAFTRACILESVRLWPTTPAIFRETLSDAELPGAGVIPKDTHLLIFVPYFHRTDARPNAHRFNPDEWLSGSDQSWPTIPFSSGPGTCPAHHLVPMIGSAMIAAILRRHAVALSDPDRLRPDQPMPGTLDNFTLSFDLRAA